MFAKLLLKAMFDISQSRCLKVIETFDGGGQQLKVGICGRRNCPAYVCGRTKALATKRNTDQRGVLRESDCAGRQPRAPTGGRSNTLMVFWII
jgi:hypothetical protein